MGHPVSGVPLDVVAEHLERFGLPPLGLQLPPIAVQLQRVAHGERLVANLGGFLRPMQALERPDLGGQVLEPLFELNGSVGIAESILRAEIVLEEIGTGIVPGTPEVLPAAVELLV